MNAKNLFSASFILIILLSLLQGCSGGQNQEKISSGIKKSGLADIDLIRSEVSSIPTNEENAKSRHAALNRWWRLMWRQGYDMSAFDSTALILLTNGQYSAEKRAKQRLSEREGCAVPL